MTPCSRIESTNSSSAPSAYDRVALHAGPSTVESVSSERMRLVPPPELEPWSVGEGGVVSFSVPPGGDPEQEILTIVGREDRVVRVTCRRAR